ncbi:prephenate dehydrogenase [Bounagaea algeriensis]
MRGVCVIGLGLIGGSILRAADRAGRATWGATTSEADAAAAEHEGVTVLEAETALQRAAAEDALVVLATPMGALRQVGRLLAWHAPEALVTDVCSVRQPATQELRSLLPGARHAGSHPMAGTAESGYAAGSAELFDGAAWAVTTEDDTDITAWRAAVELALDCGAQVVPASDAAHDAAVARVSHLSHVFAAALAATAADGGPLALSLAGGSFRDGTRVAGSDPALVTAMTEGNREALLDALDDALGRLGAARGALASTGSLKSTVESGHAARRSWHELLTSEHVRRNVSLTSPGILGRLRELGERGARVVGLDAGEATVEMPN